MKAEHFSTIEKAANDFIRDIDSLAVAQQKEGETDYLFADIVQLQRKEARRRAAESAISDGAAEAKKKAVAELDAMRAAFKAYIARVSDPGALQALTALIGANVELSEKELQAYANSGDYVVLRLLEPHSRGRIKAPNPDDFEKDLRTIENHFDLLAAYSGPNCELADSVTARPWGQSPKVIGAILKGANFPAKLSAIASRWECVRED